MTTEVLREAEEELTEAVGHYEEIEAGLGLRLKDEVRAAILWLRNNSGLPRVRPGGYQRVNLKVFPYYVAYFIWEDRIWILAVAHGHRRPEYWLERKKRIG